MRGVLGYVVHVETFSLWVSNTHTHTHTHTHTNQQGKSTDGSTGQTSCNPCSFAYLLSTHCETPWMAVILGIVGFFVLLILLRLGYKRRLMYLRDRAALQQEREAAKKNKMRDRINLKKLWTEHVVDNLKIGTDITKFVDVELHASPHAEEVVLGNTQKRPSYIHISTHSTPTHSQDTHTTPT
ncbi:hypothetical protein OAV88_02610 [bacterium]|nr:hypothetical protein [bacterium]